MLIHAGAITPVSNGTAVSSINDLSGQGNTATVANGSYRTAIFPSGMPAVRTASGAIYGNFSGSWGTAGSFVLMAVANITLATYVGLFCLHNNSFGNDYQQSGELYLSTSNSTDNVEIGAATTIISPAPAVVPTTAAVIGVGMSATEFVICDGVGVVRRRPSTATMLAQTRYLFGSRFLGGSYAGAGYPSVDIGIAGAWNLLPSDTQISGVCQWASREIGTLPALIKPITGEAIR